MKLHKILDDYHTSYLGLSCARLFSNFPLPYELLKTIYQLILPYLPAKYTLSPTDKFLQILHSNRTNNGLS